MFRPIDHLLVHGANAKLRRILVYGKWDVPSFTDIALYRVRTSRGVTPLYDRTYDTGCHASQDIPVSNTECPVLGAFTKLRKGNISFVTSVPLSVRTEQLRSLYQSVQNNSGHQSVQNNSGPTGLIFMKSDISVFF
jgi:hypothetical protein